MSDSVCPLIWETPRSENIKRTKTSATHNMCTAPLLSSPHGNKRRRLSLDCCSQQMSPLPDFNSPSSTKQTIDTFPDSSSMTAFPPLTPVVTPTTTKSTTPRMRSNTWSQEEEKREDSDCMPSPDRMTRLSPRSSPMAVLKLRTNLFPEDNDESVEPLRVTYDSTSLREDEAPLSSKSITSSMFLVSPLRPLERQRVQFPSEKAKNDLKTSLIDSSQSFLRPLTPPSSMHRAKRSFSDVIHIREETKECEDDDDDDDYFRTLSSRSTRPQFTAPTAQPKQQQPQPQQKQQRWLIPAEHPYKILWDFLTFVLSLLNVYRTHMSIRDRQFGDSKFMAFCEAWFFVDILLNFFTEYRSDNYALTDCRSVWARYLTTWFVVDVLSLFPGETLYLRPLVEAQKRRGFFKKSFFRTKAVVRVTRILRGRHLKMFGKAASHTRHVGVGARRLLHLLIKYIPKYLMFFRNMKGVLAIRMLRQVHWFRKVWRNSFTRSSEATNMQQDNTKSLRSDYDEDDDGAPF